MSFGGLAARSEALCASAKKLMGGDLNAPVVGDTTCDRVVSADGNDQYFCALEYEFRARAARQMYEELAKELTHCFGTDAVVPSGPAVNHPDSYDQTVVAVEGRQVSVALKDKGALQKTYVFVRLPAN